jgi:hypothetical protein
VGDIYVAHSCTKATVVDTDPACCLPPLLQLKPGQLLQPGESSLEETRDLGDIRPGFHYLAYRCALTGDDYWALGHLGRLGSRTYFHSEGTYSQYRSKVVHALSVQAGVRSDE